MDNEANSEGASSKDGSKMKVGDKLILRHDRYSQILTVESITKSGRINAGGYQFNPDLTKRGGDWKQAEVATQEKLDEIAFERKVAKARNGLSDIVWWKVPDSVVLAVAEAYGLAIENHERGMDVKGE